MKRRQGFTLIELVVSVGLLIISISIALFAVIGTTGLIQKSEARGAISEGGRSIGDVIRRTVDNAPIGAVAPLELNLDGQTFAAVRVKDYSALALGLSCTTIGRAVIDTSSGEEKYTINKSGDTVALIIQSIDSNAGVCPDINNTAKVIYQNRLSSSQAVVTDLRFFVQSIPCDTVTATCITKQFLRYTLTLQQLTKDAGGTAEARRPTLTFADGLPIGLINEATTALTIETQTLADGLVGQAYSQSLAASGGVPDYTWTKIGGTWPSGSPAFSLSTSGIITGTPTSAAGSPFSITVQLEDSVHTIKTKVYSIAVYSTLSITTTALSPATATQGTPYTSSAIQATGGRTPYSWSLTGNPSWMSINAVSGVISGTPDAAGTVNFSVIVTDSFYPTPNTQTKALSLTVSSGGGGGALAIQTASPLPNATATCAYDQALTATGGFPAYTWAFDGALPFQLSWLTISSGGVLSGTPSAAGGPYSFTVKVTDSLAATVSKTFSLTIGASGGSCGSGSGGGSD